MAARCPEPVTPEPASLSIIVPTLNEAGCITSLLNRLQPLRTAGHEVIVVDGGSSDATPRLAATLADRVITTAAGRARQMNAGADAAGNDVLWFMHADTGLPDGAAQQVIDAMRDGGWGRFDVRLSGSDIRLRVVERLMNWRSRVTGIATGDQAIFVSRDLFASVGGFPAIPLMEDVAISRLLRKRQPPVCLRTPQLVTSSRRWERDGVISTIFLMWRLRLAYALGASPDALARRYR